MELLRDPEPGPASGGTVGPSGEEAPRPRMSPATIAAKVGSSSLAAQPAPTFTPRSVPGDLAALPPGGSPLESRLRGEAGD